MTVPSAIEDFKREQRIAPVGFDTSLFGTGLLKAVCDKNGTIIDFRIKAVHNDPETGVSDNALAGKLYSAQYPGIKKTRLFDLMLKVMNTGKPEQTEYYYRDGGFDKWLSCSFAKLDDDLVVNNMDITERKLVELERVKNAAIIRQSEEIAQMGNWEYNLDIGDFTWSEGMYHLFNIAEGTKIRPEIYLQYATTESQFVANKVVNYIKTGTTSFEEILKISSGDDIKIIKIKAAVIYNDEGRPTGVIGVDMDITTQIKLKEEKEQLDGMFKKMQANQKQKIFHSMLLTQEEERKRIAENLHNSLGQLLYGIKLSLEQFNFSKSKLDLENLKKAKQATDRLVTEAIKESRRLSHELTPIILEELGFKEAINDICRQFSNSLLIKCEFSGLRHKTGKFVEIVIYRTIQELVTNIIKHAKATEAFVKIHIDKKSINLTVQDNGIGFIDNEASTGIGLKTIKSKIKLLNGKFSSISKNGLFTIVNISIPNLQD